MAKVKKTISINAPVEKVFGYFEEPTNLPEIWPSMVEVKDVQRLPNGGTSFRFVYKMLGVRLEGGKLTKRCRQFCGRQIGALPGVARPGMHIG